MADEEVSPPREKDLKVKLSSLGIQPEKGQKKGKIILAVFALFLILASIPAAVYLVQQRQEIKKEAVEYAPTSVYELGCDLVRAYDSNWKEIIDFADISVGDTVRLLVEGLTNEPQGITNAKFRVNGGAWQDPTGKKWGYFYLEYEISRADGYTIEAMVYNPALGWR